MQKFSKHFSYKAVPMPGKLYFKRLFQVWLRTPKKVVGLAPCSKPYWLKHASLPKPGHFQENFKEAALNFLIIIKFNFPTPSAILM